MIMQVKARNMFMGQLFGAIIGVLVSATMFIYVLWLNDTKKITLGSAEWPAVGAVSQVRACVGMCVRVRMCGACVCVCMCVCVCVCVCACACACVAAEPARSIFHSTGMHGCGCGCGYSTVAVRLWLFDRDLPSSLLHGGGCCCWL